MNSEDRHAKTGGIQTRPPKLKSRASIRVFGQHLDFEQITRTLGVLPSTTHRAGESLPPGEPFAQDLWSVDASLDRAQPLGNHLLELRRMLEPHYDFLRSLQDTAEVRSFCGLISDGRELRLNLGAGALTIFTELAIDMELSMIFLCLDEESPAERGAPSLHKNREREPEISTRHAVSSASLEIGTNLNLSAMPLELKSRVLRLRRELDPSRTEETRLDTPWCFPSNLPATAELDLHLRWLASALKRHSGLFRGISGRVPMLIRCDFGAKDDTGGVDISPNGLSACTDTAIPMELYAFLR